MDKMVIIKKECLLFQILIDGYKSS